MRQTYLRTRRKTLGHRFRPRPLLPHCANSTLHLSCLDDLAAQLLFESFVLTESFFRSNVASQDLKSDCLHLDSLQSQVCVSTTVDVGTAAQRFARDRKSQWRRQSAVDVEIGGARIVGQS